MNQLNMLFLNISTDQIFIQIENEIIKLDRTSIEDIIGPKLVYLYKKYKFKKVFLLNGPGGFTNLRVGTLAINLLNSLENGKINIYQITKIDLYKHFIDKKQLQSKGIIYIGQKKNIWLYDFNKGDYKTIKKEEIDYSDNVFFDLVYQKDYFKTKNILDIYIKNNSIILKINNKELTTNTKELNIKGEKIVNPKYFIKPIMGKQGQ